MPTGVYKRKPFTEERKRNIGIALKNSKKFQEKVRIIAKDPDRRRKISESHKGKQPINSINWKGENHPNWKGGISREYKTGFGSARYKKWRMDVFTRDNWTCQFCRIRGVYLEAHHIKSWAHYSELRFVVDNGITLCKECHKLTHNYKGKNKKYGNL